MILVTGGTGLVGCHLLFLLVNNNKKVLALKRKSVFFYNGIILPILKPFSNK
ncbi:MAG: SDR family oxidoreductase, partial [Pelagibacterales bacterium]|nr:SDR family oxidoreductase [Pelagibacterales bacterium]